MNFSHIAKWLIFVCIFHVLFLYLYSTVTGQLGDFSISFPCLFKRKQQIRYGPTCSNQKVSCYRSWFRLVNAILFLCGWPIPSSKRNRLPYSYGWGLSSTILANGNEHYCATCACEMITSGWGEQSSHVKWVFFLSSFVK